MDAAEILPVAGTVVVLRSAPEGMQVLLMRRADTGSFAGAWVFPGGRVEEGDQLGGGSERDEARRAGIRETFEEVGLEVERLSVLSRWTPPEGIPKRIRTWFFVTTTFSGQLRAAADEVTDTAWITPAEALARHARGQWKLFAPTWMTLHHLASFADADTLVASTGEPRNFATMIDGTSFRWSGLRLETAALPWTLTVEQSP